MISSLICTSIFAQNETIFSNDSVQNKNSKTTFLREDNLLVIQEVETSEDNNKKLQQQNVESSTKVSSIPFYQSKEIKNTVYTNVKDDSEVKDSVKTTEKKIVTNLNKDIQINGNWEIVLDYKSKGISIEGTENRIVNYGNKQTNPLKISLFYSNDLYDGSNDLKGFNIFTVDLKSLNPKGYLENPKIKSNYFNKVPKGEYYLILTITELDPDSNTYKLKAFRSFDSKFVFE